MIWRMVKSSIRTTRSGIGLIVQAILLPPSWADDNIGGQMKFTHIHSVHKFHGLKYLLKVAHT